MDDLVQAASTSGNEEEFPSFLYEATILGGVGAAPGARAQVILQVPEGDWAVAPEGNQEPAFVTATASAGNDQAAPEAAFTLKEVDFAFGGFGQSIAAGQQTWAVVNEGTQPHMLALGMVPAGTTAEQVLETVSRPEDATPEPGGLGEEDFRPVGGIPMQSSGTTVWTILDLEAGTYAALCFVPDPRTGLPHAMEGMVAVFEVGM